MKKAIMTIAAVAGVSGVFASTAHAEEVQVKKGDTLWGISQAHNVTVQDLQDWNNLSNHIIYAGSSLEVSGASNEPKKVNVNHTNTYTVQSGDTLWGIANENGLSVSGLKSKNKLTSDIIHPGQKLQLKGSNQQTNNTSAKSKQTEATTKSTHTVQPGDTLWGIASANGVSVSNVKAWNHLSSNTIYVGQSLKLDGPAKQTAQASAPTQNQQNTSQNNTSSNQQPSRSDNQAVKTLNMSSTAYTAYCNGCSGVTSTGINLKANPNQKVIAVDPSVIPLGTKVHVEGYGYAIAGDTGGAIKGNKIDVFFPNKSQAYQWGRKTVKVKVLD